MASHKHSISECFAITCVLIKMIQNIGPKFPVTISLKRYVTHQLKVLKFSANENAHIRLAPRDRDSEGFSSYKN